MNSDRYTLYYLWFWTSIFLFHNTLTILDIENRIPYVINLIFGWILSTYKMAGLYCQDFITEYEESKGSDIVRTQIMIKLRDNVITMIVFFVVVTTIVQSINADDNVKFMLRSVSATMSLESLMNMFVMTLKIRDQKDI